MEWANDDPDDGHCSALIKLLPDNKDIYFGHNAWTKYNYMLRMQKKYILNYNVSLNIPTPIAGFQMTFSSYPGAIVSLDDYYLISSGLATTETTNNFYNLTQQRDSMRPDNLIWESVRSMVSNRLAENGQMWSKIFTLFNSGTYNNQWMILDYKRFKPGQRPSDGAFWVLEQIPSKVIANDLTNVLINEGYWSSYNVPYNKEIYNISGYREKLQQFGNWFSHEETPRAQIFRRDHPKVIDMQSFMDLMRSNNYKHDPFSHCKCDPPYSAAGAIASRYDLNPSNGTYNIPNMQGHKSSGAIDAKITNFNLFLKLQFIGVAGPTTGTNESLPVFKWSTSGFNGPHMSHPDTWNFRPVLHKWLL